MARVISAGSHPRAITPVMGTRRAHTVTMDDEEYRIGELLGRGGMGNVFAARHRSGRSVVVKRIRDTLRGDRLLLDRFASESRLLQAVSHPNVVRALGDGTDDTGQPYLVMDRAEGTPLDALVRRDGPLAIDRAVKISLQLLAGLAAIHDARVVHADMKSANVLVDDHDNATIIDFGLARTVTRNVNELIAGTPSYMAPEVIDGQPPTVASDLYAVATILYEMLTGAPPFAGSLATILARQVCDGVEPPSARVPERGITAELDRVLLRALTKAPAGRYASARELATALADCLIPPTPEVDDGALTRQRIPSARTATADSDAVIGTALDAAHALIAARKRTEACDVLEAALASLAPDIASDAQISCEVWRLETVLAALYDALGRKERARRLSLVGYQHALRSRDPVAEARARDLVERLHTGRPRFARGSGEIPVPPGGPRRR